MEAKVNAALGALEVGIKSVVLGRAGERSGGADRRLLHITSRRRSTRFSRRVLAGDDVGTYFSNDIARKPSLDEGNPLEAVGQSARRARRCRRWRPATARRSCRPSHLSYEPRRRRSWQQMRRTSPTRETLLELRQRLGLSAAKLETVAKGVEAGQREGPRFLRRPFAFATASSATAPTPSTRRFSERRAL